MTQDRVALLIDADNVSIDVIEQAVAWVAKHYGGPHLRRAYCTPEAAVKHQDAFKRLSVRPMVNLAAGKNSTDIALAVDAIEIAVNERPDVIVIASSDSDFAPVVVRLRERGCRVVGLGQQGKVGQETRGIYDDYEVFEHRGGDDAAPAPRTRARRTTAARTDEHAYARRRRRRPKRPPAAKKTTAGQGRCDEDAEKDSRREEARSWHTLGTLGARRPRRPIDARLTNRSDPGIHARPEEVGAQGVEEDRARSPAACQDRYQDTQAATRP